MQKCLGEICALVSYVSLKYWILVFDFKNYFTIRISTIEYYATYYFDQWNIYVYVRHY